jgi:hypothetical protein
MNNKIVLPLFVLALAALACKIPSASPTPATSIAPLSTDTSLPPEPTNTPFPPAPSGLTLEVLKNGTYHAPVYDRTVTLVNGSFSDDSGAGAYSVQMLDGVAFGDLNGDDVGDAAILLVENGGGSGQFESVIAVLNSGGAPFQAGQAQLGDRVRINSMTINSGMIVLDMLVQGPNDGMCCPTQSETQTYRMLWNTIWLASLTTRTPDNQERSITITAPADGTTVTNPFTVSGSVTIAPFENTLVYRIYLPDGTQVNESSLMVDSGGIMGGPGTFSRDFDLSNAGITGPVIIQFLDLSAADGTTIAMASVVLTVH